MALGKAGYTIAVADLHADSCNAFAGNLWRSDIRPFTAPVDITDRASVPAMAEALLAHGDVGLSSTTRALPTPPDFETTDEDSWTAAINVNLTGAYFVTRQFLPAMQTEPQGRGDQHLVGQRPDLRGRAAYSVAKAGLIHFTRMLAVEYGPYGIRALDRRSLARCGPRHGRIAKRTTRRSGNRSASGIRLAVSSRRRRSANVVAFAVSDAASAMTGSTLTVDCGGLAGNDVFGKEITAGDR